MRKDTLKILFTIFFHLWNKQDKVQKGEDEIATLAETYNVQNSINQLRESEILSKAEQEGKIQIVGAIYDITTGEVKFL